MPTNLDIVYEQLFDVTIRCKRRGLLTEEEATALRSELVKAVEVVDVRDATQSQEDWHSKN